MKKAKATKQTSVGHATATNSASEITTTTIDILKPESSNFVPLAQSDIDSMSYDQLDGFMADGCKEMVRSSTKAKEIRKTLEPAIIRMHGLLSSQGARTDLADAPTWEGWMEKHKAYGSPRTFYRILREAKVIPPQIGDAYLTKDNQVAKISHLHSTAPDKVDAEIDLHDGSQPVPKTYNLKDLEPLNPWGTYCATTPHGWDVDVAISAAHKAMRRGDEGNGVYWIKQLYWTNEEGRCNINVWKQLFVYSCEDIGLADLSVKTQVLKLYKQHFLELEEIAAICKGDTRHSDLLMVIEAMLICCRAEKSRATDNAVVWFKENPTYQPPTADEVKSAVNTSQPVPVVTDDGPVYDMHTAKGRSMGRKRGTKAGRDHFFTEGARLENESSIPDFQAPVADPEKPLPTEGGL